MASNYDPNETPLPGGAIAGLLGWQVEELTPTTTNSGKFAINARFRSVEPDEVAGRMAFEMFVIGTDDDPGADDPQTLSKKGASFGYRLYNAMYLATKLPRSGSFERDCALATSSQPQLDAMTRAEFEPRTRKVKDPVTGEAREEPNQYYGRPPKTRLVRFFPKGEKKLSIEEVKDPAEGGAPSANGSAGAPQPAAVAAAPPPPPPAAVRP